MTSLLKILINHFLCYIQGERWWTVNCWVIFSNASTLQIEELGRRRIWEENLEIINIHNLEASLGLHTYELAMNHLGDLVTRLVFLLQTTVCMCLKLISFFCLSFKTTEEIKNMLTGTIVPTKLERHAPSSIRINTSPPASLDWRDKGLVTEVKMQVRSHR